MTFISEEEIDHDDLHEFDGPDEDEALPKTPAIPLSDPDNDGDRDTEDPALDPLEDKKTTFVRDFYGELKEVPVFGRSPFDPFPGGE